MIDMRHAPTTTTHRLPLLTLVILAGAGLSACTVSAEADIPDVEVTQHDLTFTGFPGAAALSEMSTELSFTQDRPALDLPKGLETTVKAVKVDLRARKGITSFDFLRTLRVTMAPSDGSAEAVAIIDYQQPATGPATGDTLSIPSRNPVNLLDQWKSDQAVITVQLSGALPEQDWSLDLGVHFSGKISYDL